VHYHYHLHLRRWVVWWIYIGVVCGIIALVNILFRNLSPLQAAMVIVMGVLFWIIGGIVAYGYGGIVIVPMPLPHYSPAKHEEEAHAATDFLFPATWNDPHPHTH
jgi:hypothetical protein